MKQFESLSELLHVILGKVDEHRDERRTISQMERLVSAAIGSYHMLLLLVFWHYGIWVMLGANIISVLTYVLAEQAARKERNSLFFYLIYIEILVHMILAVVMVGGECGFELYGFAVLPLIYYSYYVVLITEKRDDIAGRRILAILAVGISIGIKVYSRFVPAMYVLGSASVRYVMYLMNLSIIAVSVMAFQNIYISQIIAMRRTLIRKNVILDNMARTDVLTGLNNRRAVMEFLELPRQVSGTYSVVMADIDDFKKINDTYGHEQGDMVLVRLAEIFRESVRSSDIVCRWGGEEFVVVLMKCGVADAEKIADKIRKGVEKEVFPKIAGKVTMTFGIAGSENIEGEDLLETADKKLYEGKRTGKNCVIL